MKRVISLTLTLVALIAGAAVATEGTEEFSKRLSMTTHFNCPVPIETNLPSNYPLDSN